MPEYQPGTFENGRATDEGWEASPVQLALAGQPTVHLASLILGPDVLTVTRDGLHVTSAQFNGLAARTLTGGEALEAVTTALERAEGKGRAVVVVHVPGTKGGTTEVYPHGRFPGVALMFTPPLDVSEVKF